MRSGLLSARSGRRRCPSWSAKMHPSRPLLTPSTNGSLGWETVAGPT